MPLFLTSPEFLAALFTAASYLTWRIYKFLVFAYGGPMRDLPGPPSPSCVYGNLKQMLATEGTTLPEEWFERYGKVYVDHEFFMVSIWSMPVEFRVCYECTVIVCIDTAFMDD